MAGYFLELSFLHTAPAYVCIRVCVCVCVCGLFSSLRQVAFVRFLRACAICDTYTHTYTAVAVFLTAQTHSTRPLREYGHHAGPRAIPSSLIRFKRYSPSAFAPLLVPICYERGTSRVFLPLLEFNRNDSDDDDVDGCTMMTILAAQIFSSLLVYRQSKTWVVTTWHVITNPVSRSNASGHAPRNRGSVISFDFVRFYPVPRHACKDRNIKFCATIFNNKTITINRIFEITFFFFFIEIQICWICSFYRQKWFLIVPYLKGSTFLTFLFIFAFP